ncbi:MAG: hypothetical protein ACE14M_15520 [Terriglobales bacterium]
MLVRIITIDLLAGAALLFFWYVWFLRRSRRKSVQVTRWIEAAFREHATVSGLMWRSASCFQVQLKLAPSLFQRSCVVVQLFSWELPFNWLLSIIRKQQETLTFEADLDCPPSFNLEVHNHRWCGRTRRKLPSHSETWRLEHTGPYVLTTRNEWQREIMNMMNGLMASRDCDCLMVCFRRTSPHFSVTVPLQSIAPQNHSELDIFNVLRELAAGASASRF